jgi:hypothetical protein
VFMSTAKTNVGKTRDEELINDFVVERVDTNPVVPFSMEALRDQIESQALQSDSKLVFMEPKLSGNIFGSGTRPTSKQGRPRNGDFDNFPFFDEMDVKKNSSKPQPQPDGDERKTGFIFDDIISQFAKPKIPRSSSANTLNVDQVDLMNEGRLNRLSKMQSGRFDRTIEETDIIESFLKRENGDGFRKGRSRGGTAGEMHVRTSFKGLGLGRAGVTVYPK